MASALLGLAFWRRALEHRRERDRDAMRSTLRFGYAAGHTARCYDMQHVLRDEQTIKSDGSVRLLLPLGEWCRVEVDGTVVATIQTTEGIDR